MAMNLRKERKTVAILQSSYIPWKGYFDIIAMVDEFILFDDTQFTRRDWRNRNRIKTVGGAAWLTIPVITKGRYEQLISETEIGDTAWAHKHLKALENAYARAPCFGEMIEPIRALYAEAGSMKMLSAVNALFIQGLCKLAGITTRLTPDSTYAAEGRQTERLVSICKAAGATDYLSGPSARAYIEPEKFSAAGIRLHYMDYAGYIPYRQLHGHFEHHVSLLDLLFCEGRNMRNFMKS